MSWHLADDNTYKDESDTRDGIFLAALCSMRRGELQRWFLGIVMLEINGHTLPRRASSPS
jgi:hypothetical protein